VFRLQQGEEEKNFLRLAGVVAFIGLCQKIASRRSQDILARSASDIEAAD
jgi:hypothetical protein